MLAPNTGEMLILLLIFAVPIVVGIYLYLRLAVWPKRPGQSTTGILRHGFWVGVLAVLLSNFGPASNAGILNFGRSDLSPWSSIPWVGLLTPAIAPMAILALGQASWPAPKAPTRSAVIEHRRLRDFVQAKLVWTTLVAFVVTAAIIATVAFLPGFPSVPNQPPPNYDSPQMLDGRAPGYVLAIPLAISLLVLAIATVLVLLLTIRRRSLENLDSAQNKTLRVIGTNRVLRIGAYVASGLAAVAGNWLAWPQAGLPLTPMVNWIGIASGTFSLVLFFWAPPKLPEATAIKIDAGTDVPAASLLPETGPEALSRSTLALTAGAVVAGALIGGLLSFWFGWMGAPLFALLSAVMAYGVLELFLARRYSQAKACRVHLSKPLPLLLLTFSAMALVALAFMLNYLRFIESGESAGDWLGSLHNGSLVMIPLLSIILVLAAGGWSSWLVLRRGPLTKVSPWADAMMRRVALFRITKTATAALYVILAATLFRVPQDFSSNPLSVEPNMGMFGWLTLAIALGLFLFPVPRIAAGTTQSTDSGPRNSSHSNHKASS